jgi:hypothetical protein
MQARRAVSDDAVMLGPKVSINPLTGKGLTTSLELLNKAMSFDLLLGFWIHGVFRPSS